MLRSTSLSRRKLIRSGLVGGAAAIGFAALAGCGEAKVVEVVKEVSVEKIEKVEVEKIVTQIVEKLVTAAPTKPVQVTLEVTFPANVPDAVRLMTDIVNPGYMKKYPNVTIKYDGTPWLENQKKLMTRIAGDASPDVFLHDDVVMPSLSARGAILALDEYAKRDAEQIKTVVGVSSSIDQRVGKRYGLSRNAIDTSMLYNREIFETSGVEPPVNNDTPWTWEQWLENMKKLTWDKEKRSPDTVGFDSENVERWGYWSRQSYITVEWVPWILQNDAHMMDDAARNSTLDQPAVIEAMQFINDATWKWHVAPTPDQQAAEGKDYHVVFVSGRAASMSALLGQESQYPTPDKAKYEIKAMVHPINKKRGAASFNHQMMVAKATKVADEAWNFLVFQATDEESSKGVYTVAHHGLPADTRYWRIPEVTNREFYPKEIDVYFDPIEKGYGRGLYPNVAWSEWYQSIRTVFDEFIYNRISVEEGVKRAQRDSQEVLDLEYAKIGG